MQGVPTFFTTVTKKAFRQNAETPVFAGAGDKTRTYDLMITNRHFNCSKTFLKPYFYL